MTWRKHVIDRAQHFRILAKSSSKFEINFSGKFTFIKQYIGWKSTINHVHSAFLVIDLAYTFWKTASYVMNCFTNMARFYLNVEENAASSSQKNWCRGLQDFILIRISAPKISSMQTSIADHCEWILQAQNTTCWLYFIFIVPCIITFYEITNRCNCMQSIFFHC